jgi:signal transduction histidine kinase
MFGSNSVAGPSQVRARRRVRQADPFDEERARISRILHDQVGQVMSAVGLQLELLRMDFEKAAPEISARTAEIQQLLERALVHVRTLVSELNPEPLKGAGSHAQKP